MREERWGAGSALAESAKSCTLDALDVCCAMEPLAALPGDGGVRLGCGEWREADARRDAGANRPQTSARRWVVPLLGALTVAATIAWSAGIPGRGSRLEPDQARSQLVEPPKLPREWVFGREPIDFGPMFRERTPER